MNKTYSLSFFLTLLVSATLPQTTTSFASSHAVQKAVPGISTILSSDYVQRKEDYSEASQVLVPESASLLPGQIVTIRIGDMSNPRKAWKKRRRTGSPILVPCTILGMNKETMVKNNLINLLHRFGKPQENESRKGVVLSVGAAVKLYKYRLGGELLEHANSLGFDTIVKMMREMFTENTFRETGVKLVRIGDKQELVLQSSLSLRLSRESAYGAEFVQFRPADDEADRMVHTGTTFQIEKDDKYMTLTSTDVVQPLSAAVRISQADAESGRFKEGMECNAFFYSYDGMGDSGSPLVTTAIDPPRGQIRNQIKRKNYVNRQNGAQASENEDVEVGRDLNDLTIGDGPFTATVINVSSRAGAAFVDLGVTRKKGKKSGGGLAKVLGMLRFEDITSTMGDIESDEEEAALIEASLLEGSDDDDDDDVMTVEDLFMSEGDEIEEDVSDLYSLDEDGDVFLVDTSTGEKNLIGSANTDDEEEDDDEDEDDDNMFAGMSPEERLRAIGDMLEKEEAVDMKKRAKVDTELKKGDQIDVYVRSVFPQSGRFMVTLDSSVKGRKMKDLKRERSANKKLEKLAKKMGGEEGLANIQSSIGLEMGGVVKAVSKAGDWYYVEPEVEGFPVGVATNESSKSLVQGQEVKIRIEGIDESRGQLALTIVDA